MRSTLVSSCPEFYRFERYVKYAFSVSLSGVRFFTFFSYAPRGASPFFPGLKRPLRP